MIPEREAALKRLLNRDIVELVGNGTDEAVRFEIELVRLWWLGRALQF